MRDAPPGPWIVECPTGDSWLVTNPARESQQVYPYFGRFASEAEALTVRDALNGVRAAAPAPREPSDAAIAAALNVMPHRRMVPFEPYGFGGAPELHPEEVRTALRAAYAVEFGLPRLEAPEVGREAEPPRRDPQS